MSERNNSIRIDWFDGTVIEEPRANISRFTEEEKHTDVTSPSISQEVERKPIGYKRLLDISFLKPPTLNLELSNRPGFWLLFTSDIKSDYIVIIVKILCVVYKSLTRGEKNKLTRLLESKFLKSDFLFKLEEYLNGLPDVRISEKRMNMQLWEDVETFYFNVLTLCEGMVEYGLEEDILQLVLKLIDIAEVSSLGVQEEHSERIGEGFYKRILVLKNKLEINKSQDINLNMMLNVRNEDPQYFINLNIFPTKEDVLGKSTDMIKPNIIDGAYSDVEHYLDLQFKLLREDCFRPLREGILKYLENPTKRRQENIWIYPKVCVIQMYVSNNKVGYLVDIARNERLQHKSVDCKINSSDNRLMFGSLLLFTSNNFKTVLSASVLDSNLNLLKDGYIAVTFESPVSNSIFSSEFMMIECEVFFEPYHRVLKVLQSFSDNELPMKEYIVDVQPKTQTPAYLTSETIYSIKTDKNEEIYFPVLDSSQWPSKESFGLDQSQFDAYRFALTRDFAVIQGPPGTGKTFIGVKIASTILKNMSLEGTPILIICYTNHALDQFLEGILNTTKSVVRLGSQSKSKVLETYTLSNLRAKVKSKYYYLFANKRGELEKVFKEINDYQTEVEKCDNEVLSYNTVRPFLKLNDELFELNSYAEDAMLDWLFGHLETSESKENVESDDWESQLDDLTVFDQIETCFSEKWAVNEIDSMNSSIKYVEDITEDVDHCKRMTDKFKEQIDKVTRRLEYFKKNVAIRGEDKKKLEISKINNLYELTPDQRWIVYFNAVDRVKAVLLEKMKVLLDRHKSLGEELEEVSTLIDSDVMRTVRVVGVTTTLAARRHDLMRKLLSPIVIVEEAAEVLEGHIVASLTDRCQHLILIGDHKQLRPTTAHYKLATHYKLEISLFERMLRNGVHARTLCTQHRMRPAFVELLVPDVYERLDSHPVVCGYPKVRGMKDDMYFFNHNTYEDSENSDSHSHRNTLEASFCVETANYLLQQGYTADEVTVLAAYTGQTALIQQLSKKYSSLRDVKVTVVDNFQGEESRIVILSLVRSNRDGNIGFLSASSRVCVALSRAREGLYIFGNMRVLRSRSPLWSSIHDKLGNRKCIGDSLVLRCERHNKYLHVKTPDDFFDCSKRSCLKICDK